jgi:hypothetical protein
MNSASRIEPKALILYFALPLAKAYPAGFLQPSVPKPARTCNSLTGSRMALSFVNGALIWGLIFGQAYRFLPGRRPWQKGVFFGVCAWAVMGLLFFPLVDRGFFAINYGLGIAPTLLMLIMMLSYSVTMSLIYHLLSGE